MDTTHQIKKIEITNDVYTTIVNALSYLNQLPKVLWCYTYEDKMEQRLMSLLPPLNDMLVGTLLEDEEIGSVELVYFDDGLEVSVEGENGAQIILHFVSKQ